MMMIRGVIVFGLVSVRRATKLEKNVQVCIRHIIAEA